VDTHLVKIEGYKVEEIGGGCFCCKFNDLVEAAKKLITKVNPDVILAEPVGSCTDLVATVIRPLKFYHKDYKVLSYTTLLDPQRAEDIVISGKVSGFSENVTYVFNKQLEESDIIVLNKIDTLNLKKTKEIILALKKKFPQAKIMAMSSRTGKGFNAWVKKIETQGISGKNIAEVDYDIYAQGEKELAWLNSVVSLSARKAFSTEEFLKKLVAAFKSSLYRCGGEIAHLKLALSTEKGNSFIHLTQSLKQPEFFKKDSGLSDSARLIVNARVHTDPKALSRIVKANLRQLCKREGIEFKFDSLQYFQPGRPVPVHRFAKTQTCY
jgi:G3E family GTPase